MKTRKSVLSSAIAGALFAVSSAAIAQGPSPDMSVPEMSGEVCMEQQVSVLAAIAERQGCAATTGTYTLSGDINYLGAGSCTLDDFTVTVALGVAPTIRGSNHVTLGANGEVDDVNVNNLAGSFWFSGEGEILYGSSVFNLNLTGADEAYDEHIIKDFWSDPQSSVRLVLDDGLEVITKNNWPRMKYRQSSTYTPPNGGIGNKTIDKISVAPDNAPVCNIQFAAQVDDFGGGYQFTGAVIVF